MLLFFLIIAQTRSINGEDVSFGHAAAFTFLFFLILIAIYSWMTLNALKEEFEQFERELKAIKTPQSHSGFLD